MKTVQCDSGRYFLNSFHCAECSPDTSSSTKTSPPAGKAQKPNSFLFRTSSQSSGRPTGTGPLRVYADDITLSPQTLLSSASLSGSSWSLGQSGRSESRTTLRSPKEERADVVQLRKVHSTTHANFLLILGLDANLITMYCISISVAR